MTAVRPPWCLLSVTGVHIHAPGGRPLFADLHLTLDAGDRVALVGRNGVGKSALLRVLAGDAEPERGHVRMHGRSVRVPQLLEPGRDGEAPVSPGELRRRRLDAAFELAPDLLLLDEPTHDLDTSNLAWLQQRLSCFRGALVVVSHDPRVLRAFGDFFLIGEDGGRHLRGTFAELVGHLERVRSDERKRYARSLGRLLDAEQHDARVRRRRQRKKNMGRIRELKRCPSRAKLNDKRSYKQESQGKRAILQRARLQAVRDGTKAARRVLAVDLPLELALPELPLDPGPPIVTLERVACAAGDRRLFEQVSLQLTRQRLAVIGPNGSGKSTLLAVLAGERRPAVGRAIVDPRRIGYVAQDADNYRLDYSLLELLAVSPEPSERALLAAMLDAHGFPPALAARPLRSLSPGERLRAALLHLARRRPAPELLILDEPVDHLDFLGAASLESLLRTWRGGLVIASHDRELLDALEIEQHIELGRGAVPADRSGQRV